MLQQPFQDTHDLDGDFQHDINAMLASEREDPYPDMFFGLNFNCLVSTCVMMIWMYTKICEQQPQSVSIRSAMETNEYDYGWTAFVSAGIADEKAMDFPTLMLTKYVSTLINWTMYPQHFLSHLLSGSWPCDAARLPEPWLWRRD